MYSRYCMYSVVDRPVRNAEQVLHTVYSILGGTDRGRSCRIATRVVVVPQFFAVHLV